MPATAGGDLTVRVLHVTPYFAPAWDYGGPPRSIHGLCRALRGVGVDARVLTTTAAGSSGDFQASGNWEDESGVPVRRFARSSHRSGFFSPALHRALRAELASSDLLHVHGLWNAVSSLAMRAARRHRLPYVLSPRGMLLPAALERSARKKLIAWHLLERRNVRGAVFLHATSPLEGKALAARLPGRPILEVPNGVEEEDFAPVDPEDIRRRWDLSSAKPLVLFLGRLHPIKRLDLLAGAMRRVLVPHPAARLVLAGPEGAPLGERTTALLAELGPACLRIGSLTSQERRALLGSAAALVLCSDSENFGRSVVEALAQACPVVATQTTPWALLEEERCGRWVAQNEESIAGALLSILHDPEEARAMGRRGRDLAQERFGWAALARRLLQAYETALRRGTAA